MKFLGARVLVSSSKNFLFEVAACTSSGGTWLGLERLAVTGHGPVPSILKFGIEMALPPFRSCYIPVFVYCACRSHSAYSSAAVRQDASRYIQLRLPPPHLSPASLRCIPVRSHMEGQMSGRHIRANQLTAAPSLQQATILPQLPASTPAHRPCRVTAGCLGRSHSQCSISEYVN